MDVPTIDNKKIVSLSKENEGLVFYGAGGDLTEWVNGINLILKEEEIISKPLDEVYLFKNNERQDLLFMFNDTVKTGKLALWRIAFGGVSWLSDYIDNENISSNEKPKVKLLGEDGNAYYIIGKVSKTLRKAGLGEKVKEFQSKATSGDYNHLLQVVMEYCEIE